MHHQDFAGESAGTGGRKMSHPSGFHHRRGSSGTSAPSSAASGGGGNGDAIAGVESGAQAGSSSPGLHHQLQSQAAGAQVKKKSGFQITSVTSAQINVSANNSLADDTESYDDMDESHTEDLSSSDMLDVSVSRATDTGVPERSSSDETLNSLHGVDTPGLVSPNEPLHPQGSQPLASMMNGTLHQIPSHFHHHHGHQSDHPEVAQGTSPVAPSANSSPAMIPKAGSGQDQPQRITLVNNTGAVAGTTTLPAAAVGVPGAPPSGPTGFDSGAVGGQGAFIAGGAVPSVNAPNGQAPHSQAQAVQGHTQVTTGSRFRVVKLDTISEPFRKGRWTCTDYYEKEVPHAVASETPKGTEVAAAEPEVGNQGAAAAGPVASQPPQTLQPHQQPSQDFTSPQAMQSPPQPPPQNPPLAQMPLQELSGGAPLIQQPIGTMPLSAAGPQVVAPVMPHQVPSQMGYPATHLPVGVGGRQPDFIQPTAPFQTQVQQPLAAHAPAGVSMTIGHGGGGQPSLAVTQQLPLQGQGAPAAVFTPGQPQRLPAQPQQQQQHPLNPQAQAPAPSSLAPAPSILAPVQGTPYVPLTALQADLQPLLTPGATFSQTSALGQVVAGSGVPLRSSHLEDAQRLLFQHRLEQQAAGTLAHMGMAAEASALMVAAAAGLRVQPAEGDEDSSSGASVVAIDNKIEQAMDLVKSHLMYAVREEVEVLKEQIKELLERNSQLEQENTLLKTLASPEQMAQFQAQVQSDGSPTGGAAAPPPPPPAPLATLPAAPGPVAGASPVLNSGPSA